jgi:hypothetical protein
MKIVNGTKIQLFKKVRRWDPLKGEVLKTNEKSMKKRSENQWFLMVLNH